MAIDYGLKRTGIAVTDPLQIIATGLDTIPSTELIPYLTQYLKSERVELILVGLPVSESMQETHGTEPARQAIARLRQHFPAIDIREVDERFTSRMARNAMLDMGMKKKERRVKGHVDRIAATILLQEYLQYR